MTPRRLRVLIDARMLLGRFSGVSRVVTRLVDELTKSDDIRITAMCGATPYAPWLDRSDIDMLVTDFTRADRTVGRRLLWEEMTLPKVIRSARVDLFHATWNSGIPFRCPVPAVLTIHDLIPWESPKDHFATFASRTLYRYGVRSSARRAAVVTTVSDYTRSRVLDRLGVPPNRVITVPNGVDLPPERFDQGEGVKQTGQRTETKPYVLYIGGHERRKNVAAVFNAMRCYWKRFDPMLELRLTGQASSLDPEARVAFLAVPENAPVRFLGAPSDDELAGAYQGATALFLLSRQEGFGLPVLEAMAHGCPVIAARRTSLPEVVGEGGILVNPDQPSEIAEQLHGLVTSPSHRGALIAAGRRHAARFAWSLCAQRMRRAYDMAMLPDKHAAADPASADTRHSGLSPA